MQLSAVEASEEDLYSPQNIRSLKMPFSAVLSLFPENMTALQGQVFGGGGGN